MDEHTRAAGRSWLFLSNVVALLGMALFGMALGLSGIIAFWDPCTMFASGLLLMFSTAFTWCVYVGVFRRHALSQLVAIVLLGAVAVLIGIGCAATLAEVVWQRSIEFEFGLLLAGVTLFGVWLYASAVSLVRHLPAAEQIASEGQTEARFSLRELFIAVAACALLFALTMAITRSGGPAYALHVSPDEVPFSLPAGASDVNYARGSRSFLVYDFAIDEAEFLAWANAFHGEHPSVIQPIQNSRYVTDTQTWLSGGPPVEVFNGYEYRGSIRGLDLVYDKDRGRAYFMSSH